MMITIIADDKKETVGQSLYKYYEKSGIEVEFFSASERDIKPCYGCDGCTYKTYGKCVIRDDMGIFLPELLRCDILVYTSPILWAGFSYDIKKIVDKMALTGSRFYHVRNREMTKGTLGKMKKIVGIGVGEGVSEKEQVIFRNYIKEIATIIDVSYLGEVVGENLTDANIGVLAREVCRV